MHGRKFLSQRPTSRRSAFRMSCFDISDPLVSVYPIVRVLLFSDAISSGEQRGWVDGVEERTCGWGVRGYLMWGFLRWWQVEDHVTLT